MSRTWVSFIQGLSFVNFNYVINFEKEAHGPHRSSNNEESYTKLGLNYHLVKSLSSIN